MKKRLLSSLLVILFLCVLCACTESKNSTFNGSKTGDSNHYDISFDILNTTYTHELSMKTGESILVHIEKKSGDIKVEIFDSQNVSIYEGNGEVLSDFSVGIAEDGIYTVSVTGKEAKGHASFERK